MIDGPENLNLVYLRRMDGKLDQAMTVLGDHGGRLTALETAVANLAAAEASHYASTALRMDYMSERGSTGSSAAWGSRRAEALWRRRCPRG